MMDCRGTDIFEDAQDVHLKFLDFIALENGLADGVLAGAHVAERVNRNLPGSKLRPDTPR